MRLNHATRVKRRNEFKRQILALLKKRRAQINGRR